jgi:hypothetical protein
MRSPPDPWLVQVVAIFVYLAILAIGFGGAALGHPLIEAVLNFIGLGALFAP